MATPHYRDARRVFWIVSTGNSHHGKLPIHRPQGTHPRLVPVHSPVYASWLKQIEIYFSIMQRKVLTRNDFPSLVAASERLLAFPRYYETISSPFYWSFTIRELDRMFAKIDAHPSLLDQKVA